MEGLALIGDALGALLFIDSANMMMQAFGTHQSSPWTVESFGADPVKNAAARKYMRRAVVNAGLLAGIAALVSRRWWPIVGVAAEGAYLWWEYESALAIAEASGSTDWSDAG